MSFASFGQHSYSTVTYNMALPTSSLTDFVDEYSFRGIGLEYGRFVKEKLSAGISLGWNVFYQAAPSATYDLENTLTVTGKTYRYINAYPLILKAHYYLGEPHKTPLLPYIGAGIGTTFARQRLDFGVYSYENNAWQFGVYPEIGTFYSINSNANITANIRYNIGFEAGGLPSVSFIGFNLGLAFSK
ncbi:outer membrane beta-barrel protein [Solitalea koreensis]|uniref:outer membrane beta-barrel protein n=1 Tax=Solitalea koreensis TaxID=543615 RepID=UPI00163DC6D9|nr:outer membrane beta-barrel protein [Solitalea koreensis]